MTSTCFVRKDSVRRLSSSLLSLVMKEPPRAHMSESPIGNSNTATIHSMVDTCAGLNLGRLPYHGSIYETSPHLVDSFIYLKDVDYLDEFDIGGADERGNPTRVTAVITYKTPFRVSGQQVLLSFGLSESASTDTILGIPFLRANQSAMIMIMTGSDNETLICQRIGATFRVDYQVPLPANKAPMSSRDTHAAYPYHAATPACVAESLDNIQQLLATVALASPKENQEIAPESDESEFRPP
jgi:hypothetical protein